MSRRDAPVFELRLYSPPPPDPPGVEMHGGLKLDWHSDVGRTGVLLDWWPVGRGVDAGVPVPVARALSAGFCAVTTVAGCTLDAPEATGPEWAAVPGGYVCRYPGRRWLGIGPHPLGLRASREVDVVTQLFDDDDFGWALESQVLFLAPPDQLPRLDRAVVEACFAVPIRTSVARLASAGVVGVVCAGVDGDVAGLYVPDPEWRRVIMGALADAALGAGGRWEERDGATFWPDPVEDAARGGK